MMLVSTAFISRRFMRVASGALCLMAASGLSLPKTPCRRSFLSGMVTVTGLADPSWAIVTDETDNFGDNWWTKGQQVPQSRAVPQQKSDDEVTVSFPASEVSSRRGLGLELADVEFRTSIRVYVKSVQPGSLASDLGIQKDWIVVGINGKSTERTNAQGVAQMLSSAVKQQQQDSRGVVDLSFRDPNIFSNRLSNLQEGESVTTSVAPAGDDDTAPRNAADVRAGRAVTTTQTDQKVTVSQLVAPPMCRRGAQADDLLEISYLGTVLETGAVFDGSAIRINGQGVPGRGNDVSLFFVLGKQPLGQFPPGWDVGLVGMCVGERRRLIVPPVLAYGAVGQPRRGIPPDATLQYDITLVSINGLATPQ